MNEKPHKVILDVDTGSDDAVAIMAALLSPALKVEGICTVVGNKPLKMTTVNTLRVVAALGSDVPVYMGCAEPMVRTICPNRLPPSARKELVIDGKLVEMHADYLDLPDTDKKPEELSAPEYYIRYLENATEPVTIIAVGPLTNLAVALTIRPELFRCDKLKQIMIMGGGFAVSNQTPCAEFNIWHDPEAAQKVLESGAKITLVPLDATHQAYMTKEDCKNLRALHTFAGDFAAELVEQRIVVHNHLQPLEVPDAAAVHDALAVCAVIDERVLEKVELVHCDVGLSDYAEGQTIVDRRYYPLERNCRFAFGADRKRFATLLLSILSRKGCNS